MGEGRGAFGVSVTVYSLFYECVWRYVCLCLYICVYFRVVSA